MTILHCERHFWLRSHEFEKTKESIKIEKNWIASEIKIKIESQAEIQAPAETCRTLARKLKLMTFSQNWEITQVFTKSPHHG